jgi:hypothetical protein
MSIENGPASGIMAELGVLLPREVQESLNWVIFPEVLEDWLRNEVVEYLSARTLRGDLRLRLKRLQKAIKAVQEALTDIRLHDGDQILTVARRLAYDPSVDSDKNDKALLMHVALEELAAGTAALSKRLGSTSRQSRPEYFHLICDLAAIYSWLGGKEASRAVSSQTGNDVSRFYQFAEIIWPEIFGQKQGGRGISHALRAWAESPIEARSSAVMSNISRRNPEWRIPLRK